MSITFEALPFTVNVVTTPFFDVKPRFCQVPSVDTVTSVPWLDLTSSAALDMLHCICSYAFSGRSNLLHVVRPAHVVQGLGHVHVG